MHQSVTPAHSRGYYTAVSFRRRYIAHH